MIIAFLTRSKARFFILIFVLLGQTQRMKFLTYTNLEISNNQISAAADRLRERSRGINSLLYLLISGKGLSKLRQET